MAHERSGLLRKQWCRGHSPTQHSSTTGDSAVSTPHDTSYLPRITTRTILHGWAVAQQAGMPPRWFRADVMLAQCH